MKKLVTLIAAIAFSTTAFAANVKSGKIGLGFATSLKSDAGNLNVWWHATDMIALVPSVGFEYASSQDDIGSPSTTTSTTDINFGLGLPIYIANFNKLDLFLAPGFTYRVRSEDPKPLIDPASPLNVYLNLGAQLAVTDQLALVGQMGINYNSDGNDSKKAAATSTISTEASGLFGVIFYFN